MSQTGEDYKKVKDRILDISTRGNWELVGSGWNNLKEEIQTTAPRGEDSRVALRILYEMDSHGNHHIKYKKELQELEDWNNMEAKDCDKKVKLGGRERFELEEKHADNIKEGIKIVEEYVEKAEEEARENSFPQATLMRV